MRTRVRIRTLRGGLIVFAEKIFEDAHTLDFDEQQEHAWEFESARQVGTKVVYAVTGCNEECLAQQIQNYYNDWFDADIKASTVRACERIPITP